MFDSPEGLLAKIQLGEDTSLELKSVRFRGTRIFAPGRDDLADEIAAMANTQDGVIVFGVDDRTREIEGIARDRLEIVERLVFEICNQSIRPPVLFRSFRSELPDTMGDLRPILKVEIPLSLFVHESPNGFFYRQGSSKRRMPPEYLARLLQQRSQVRLVPFDEWPVPGTTVDDLSPALWTKFTGRLQEAAETTLLKRGILVQDQNRKVRSSVAGVLMCSERPDKFLPSAFIEAVAYRGTFQDSNYQTDAQRITGPLDVQVTQAMAFCRRNEAISATKKPHRIETPQFSDRAVFEALVNAVAHRDYSITGSKIRFFIFHDRLELYSPGALPNTVTIESMPLRQATRNELVTSLLAEIPVAGTIGDVGRTSYMEKRGDGVPIIFHESEKLSARKPVYQLIDDSELLLTIFAAPTG